MVNHSLMLRVVIIEEGKGHKTVYPHMSRRSVLIELDGIILSSRIAVITLLPVYDTIRYGAHLLIAIGAPVR